MAQRGILLKFGWLPHRGGCARLKTMPILFASCLAFAVSATAGASTIVFAGGHWAAIDFGSRCEARSRPLWFKPDTKPFAGFAFGRSGVPHGQFYVRLGSPARVGATVVATIGDEPFLLAGKGEWAWSRNSAQQQAMLNAARYGQGMRIDSRDTGGRRIVDRYDLSGAATAIDAAAAACAGKSK
jgi:hypothetical protein